MKAENSCVYFAEMSKKTALFATIISIYLLSKIPGSSRFLLLKFIAYDHFEITQVAYFQCVLYHHRLTDI